MSAGCARARSLSPTIPATEPAIADGTAAADVVVWPTEPVDSR